MSAMKQETNDREAEALRRAQRAHEPSMEEILASIRAIIADDKGAAAKAPAAPAAQPKTATGPQIIYSNFGQSKPADPPARALESPALAAIADRPRPSVEPPPRPALEPAPLPPRPTPRPPIAPPRSEPAAPSLLSKEVETAVASSFNSLSAAVAAPDPRRLDEMAREMLKPMLKSWLDENLPALVERLVRVEIERIARGPRKDA